MKDPMLLEAALEGLELQKQRIEQQIREVRLVIGKRRGRLLETEPAPVNGDALPKKKRQLSESARRRIAAAQKRRWAEYRKAGQQKA